MAQRLTQEQLNEALQFLGLTHADIEFPLQTGDAAESDRRLADLKTKAKSGFRRAAMQLHPDRTNNDPQKTEQFKLVSVVAEELEKLSIVRRQPPPMPMPFGVGIRIVFIRHGFVQPGAGVRTTTTTTTTTSTVSSEEVWRMWNG